MKDKRRKEPSQTMDSSPTTLFNNYEQDFQQIIASIRDKVEGNSQSEGVGEWFRCKRFLPLSEG